MRPKSFGFFLAVAIVLAGILATAELVAAGTVTGQVLTSTGFGLQGVTITHYAAGGVVVSTTTTDATGAYTIPQQVYSGNLLTPSMAGYTFSPGTVVYDGISTTISWTATLNTYTVTPSAVAGGTIAPATPQTVNYNASTAFTITPDTGYSISTVTGCGGALTGSTYTTGPITANCTVAASFTPISCTYTLYQATNSVISSSGATATVIVEALPSGCIGNSTWTATSNDAWLTITSGNSGTGSGTVNYSVSANTTTSQRTGTLSIAGQTFSVTQAGLTACTSYVLSSSSGTGLNPSGVSGSITVTATPSGCSGNWTATSDVSWLTITSGGSGTGNGAINFSASNYYTAPVNGDRSRQGIITVVDANTSNAYYSFVQIGAPACTASASGGQSVSSSGGTGSVNVTGSPSDCQGGFSWTATSNASWITITSGSSGTGSGTVSYTVSANADTSSRTGSITIGGQTVYITQEGHAFQLKVYKARNGSGKVTSSPAGIDCGAVCEFTYTENTAVTLTATPDAGSAFGGWSGGGCSGAGTCTVSMTGATEVVAYFDAATYTLSVKKAGSGTGTVKSADGKIDCGNSCSGAYTNGATATLTATASTDSIFAGWSGGGCSGAEKTCTITIDNAKTVTAMFNSSTTNKAKAIIIAGRTSATDNIWPMAKELAGNVYSALSIQGYAAENIYYLSPEQTTKTNSGLPTGDNLKKAITEWAAGADSLVMYMIGHGGKGTIRTSGSEIIQASDINTWLDSLQQTMKGQIIIVYEACRSGSFVDALKGSNRVVITSASAVQQAYLLDQGSVSFSSFFWNEVLKGQNLNEAFVRGKNGITLSVQQTPQLDADGNGTPDESGDKELAASITIGNAIAALSDNPVIGSISPDIQLDAQKTSAEIYIEDITSSQAISDVWAYITPPGSVGTNPDQSVTNLVKVGLTKDSKNNKRYKATYYGFITQGEYGVAVYARDVDKNISEPLKMTITQSGTTANSGNCSATIGLNDAIQVHEPYLMFGGFIYWLEFQNAQDAQFPETDFMLKLTNYGGVTDISAYSGCQAASLETKGSEYLLHIPSLIYNGVAYWVDLTLVPTADGKIWFRLSGVGEVK